MIDMKKSYTTRDGRPVRLLWCVDGPDSIYPVVAFIDGCHHTNRFTIAGKWEAFRDGHNDLIEAKIKRSGWINVFPDRNVSKIYECEYDANMGYRNAISGQIRIACLQIEWEE